MRPKEETPRREVRADLPRTGVRSETGQVSLGLDGRGRLEVLETEVSRSWDGPWTDT